jgi:hypothetical protein
MTDTDPAEAQPLEDVDQDEAQLLLADPEDYHEAQRLREIHEARREVRTVLTGLDTYTETSEHRSQKGALAAAITAYIAELEPLIVATGYDDSLRDGLPWRNLRAFADAMGFVPEENGRPGYNVQMAVFREANSFLAEVKPLLEEEDTDTWEV